MGDLSLVVSALSQIVVAASLITQILTVGLRKKEQCIVIMVVMGWLMIQYLLSFLVDHQYWVILLYGVNLYLKLNMNVILLRIVIKGIVTRHCSLRVLGGSV